MIFLRRITAGFSSERSASSARERLLQDRAMHTSRGRRVALAHRSILESAPAIGHRGSSAPVAPLPTIHLSPQEQRRRLIDVASAFDGHYLAAIDFIAERDLTVGVIKPACSPSATRARTVQICVDARGNVSVSPSCRERPRVVPAVAVVWLMALVVVCAVFVILL